MSREHYAKLLCNTAHAGTYRISGEDKADLLAAAEASGFAVFRVDLSAVRNKDGLMQAIAAALEFPEWFGHNWDALADCLADLSWRQAAGYLILLEHCDSLRASCAEAFAATLQICAAAAERWRNDNVPFWVLAELHTKDIALLPEPS
jgi:RNAse (barnase) inhibitor barstar